MKVIVTGATGFVGSHLVRYFGETGNDVVAIGRQKRPPKALLNYASWLGLDLTSDQFPSLEADVLIHAAALTAPRGPIHSFRTNNVQPSSKLLRQFKGKHFIYISSASIYPFSNHPLHEEDSSLQNKLSNYGQSKLEAEISLLENHKTNCKLTILRPRSIYGPHDRVLLPRILQLYKKKITLIGSMNIQVSMTHISNLLEAVDGAIHKQIAQKEIYNVADHKVYNLRSIIVKLINAIAGQKLKIKELPLPMISLLTRMSSFFNIPFLLTPQSLAYLSKSCILDTAKIQKDLSLNLDADFDKELDSLIAWIQKVGVEKVRSKDPNLPWLGL